MHGLAKRKPGHEFFQIEKSGYPGDEGIFRNRFEKEEGEQPPPLSCKKARKEENKQEQIQEVDKGQRIEGCLMIIMRNLAGPAYSLPKKGERSSSALL